MAASAALLFSFSAILFLLLLLHAPAPEPAPGLAVADLLVSTLDRVRLDGRGLMELATRRNMILLCHAILFLILRDAGVLGKPAPASRRRSRSPPGEATAVSVAGTEIACSAAPGPARPHATRGAVVVWRRQRRPRNRVVVAPVHEHDAAGRAVVECRPALEAAATWATPPLITTPALAAEEAAAVATKQIVVAESPRNDDDDDLIHRHDRAAVVEPLEHPSTAIAVADGETDGCDDRRIVAVADDDDKHMGTAEKHEAAGMEMEMELADDRAFEEFIKSQRRQMRQEESLQLISSGSGSGYRHYQYQAITTCY